MAVYSVILVAHLTCIYYCLFLLFTLLIFNYSLSKLQVKFNKTIQVMFIIKGKTFSVKACSALLQTCYTGYLGKKQLIKKLQK